MSPGDLLDEAIDEREPLENRIPLLIADPDDDLRRALAASLSAAGYAVSSASDGTDALEQAQRTHFAVVIAGLDIEGIDGAELVCSLLDIDPYTECILLASPDDILRIVETSEIGNVFNHFWKPITELGDIIRSAGRALERRELRMNSAYLLSELRDTRHELGTLTNRMEQLDKVAALGQMTTAISHDLESPLKMLLGYAQYLRTRLGRNEGESLSAEQVDRIMDYMSEMERGVRKCSDVIAGIMDYTQVHTEPPGPVNLNEVISESLDLLQYSLEQQGIGLRLDLLSTPLPVRANSRRLQQALLSLLLNAQQAMAHTGGVISVTSKKVTTPEGNMQMQVIVADNGEGIAPGVMPHIFDPFFTTHPRPESMGIGLSIARKMVREWRGDVRVESRPGNGVTATIVLPVCVQTVSGTDEGEFSVISGENEDRRAA